MSPGFPNQYPLNKECTWIILVPNSKNIKLQFREFELEKHSNCRYDYLEVRDGDGPQKSLLGKFCGDKVPSPVKSSENYIYIKFYSDGLIPKRGFVLRWHSIDRPSPPPGPVGPDGNNIGTVRASKLYKYKLN